MIVVAAALALVALASHVVPVKYGRDRPPSYSAGPAATRSIQAPPTPPTAAESRGRDHPLAIEIVSYTLLAIIAAGLVWGLVNVLMTRMRGGRREWRRAPDGDGDRAAAQLAARIVTAVDQGLDELMQGPVTDAIIACWLRLEAAADTAGISLRRSDTPAETVVRMLELGSGRRLRPEPLRALAELYREARFSRHVMHETDRDAAQAALRDIRADLDRRDDSGAAGASTVSSTPGDARA